MTDNTVSGESIDLEKVDLIPVGQLEQRKKLIEGGTCPQPDCNGRLHEVSVRGFAEWECDVCTFRYPKAYRPPFVKKEKEEPVTPKGYGELKVGMEGVLNGVPVVIRKMTKKDIILRPLNRAIRDEAGLMVSFKDKKKIIENREVNSHG